MKRIILSMALILLVQAPAWAQCAMCRGTVENNVAVGDTSVGAGLNTGILYLFFMPYALFAVIAFFWYKAGKQNAFKKEQIRSRLGL